VTLVPKSKKLNKNWKVKRFKYSIGIVLAFCCFAGLYAFANKRNEKREFGQLNVRFVDQKNRFISKATVNKLLIQNKETEANEQKEILALKRAEQEIQSLAHIRQADIYHSVSHNVNAIVEEQEPVARLFSSQPKYLSATGDLMPLSTNIAIRVPMIYSFSENHKQDVLRLLTTIKQDAFLKQNVVGIRCLKKKDYSLDLRNVEANVILGGLTNLESKVKNLKVFFVKAKQDRLLQNYKQLNLKVKNQVICTKK